METYTMLRGFADSWMLLFMAILFVGIVIYVLRPSAKKKHEDAANIPLRNEQPRDEESEDGR